MANAITVAATNGPLQVAVSDPLDTNGNPTEFSAPPVFSVTGPATIAPIPGAPYAAYVTLAGVAGEVSVLADFGTFSLPGVITVTAGPAVTATLNISA